MSGQLWAVAAEGGYMYSDELSDYLRIRAQPLTKMRQLCDAKDGAEKGLNRGDKFYWDVYSDIGTQGRQLDENQPMPESNYTIGQRSLTVTEAGNSVPYTGKLTDMAKHDVTEASFVGASTIVASTMFLTLEAYQLPPRAEGIPCWFKLSAID